MKTPETMSGNSASAASASARSPVQTPVPAAGGEGRDPHPAAAGEEESASPWPVSSSGNLADAPARGGFWRRLLALLGLASAPAGHGQGGERPAEPTLAGLLRVPVGEIAIPRAEIVAVEDDLCLEDLVDVFRRTKFSRLPVYHGSLDEPCGLVHLKDLALEYGFTRVRKPFALKHLLRPLIYVPPSMPVGTLLQKMKTERTHMALVIDEYGGVDGLVTLEDLVETVIGEIEDEHDIAEEAPWCREGERSWLVDATAELDDFRESTGLDLETEESRAEDVDTFGGLVFVLAGRVPARGEVIRHPAGHEFEIVDADPRRIRKLRLRLAGPAAAAAPV